MSIERLNYGRSWNNSEDFPRYQPDEAKVREDLQYHPDEIKNFLNGVLIPKLEQEGVEEILRTDGTTLKYVRLGEGRLLESSLDGRTWEQVKARPPAQPDWEQNDETALDYIKNRPFYEGEYEEVLLPETVADCSGETESCGVNTDFSFVAGETYIVSVNGKTREVVAQYYEGEDWVPGELVLSLEEFSIVQFEGGTSTFIFSKNGPTVFSLSISHVAAGVKKLPSKYLDMDYIKGEIGETGVQPDWEQNDETALDYIKNRPFYEGEYEEVLLPETAVDCSGEMQMANLDVDFSLVDGETYFVDWDETRYECVAEMSEDGLDGTCIRLVFGSESIEAYGGYISIQSDTQSVVTLSITHVANGTKTISPKYLPTETWTFTLEDGTVIEKKVVVAE